MRWSRHAASLTVANRASHSDHECRPLTPPTVSWTWPDLCSCCGELSHKRFENIQRSMSSMQCKNLSDVDPSAAEQLVQSCVVGIRQTPEWRHRSGATCKLIGRHRTLERHSRTVYLHGAMWDVDIAFLTHAPYARVETSILKHFLTSYENYIQQRQK